MMVLLCSCERVVVIIGSDGSVTGHKSETGFGESALACALRPMSYYSVHDDDNDDGQILTDNA